MKDNEEKRKKFKRKISVVNYKFWFAKNLGLKLYNNKFKQLRS